MGRKPKEQKLKELTESRLSHETKKSVVAILCFGLALVSVLASFGKAGPAGELIYGGLNVAFGWGYYLFPTILALIAAFLLFGHERKFLGITFTGAGLFIISGLGIIDLLSPGNGGFAGQVVGGLENFFGFTASLILTISLFAASLLITLNIPLRFKLWKEKTEDEKEEIEEKELIIKSPTAFTPDEDEEEKEEKEKEYDEEESEEEKAKLIVREATAAPAKASALTLKNAAAYKNYVPPPLSLLKSSVEKPTSGDLRANANIIKRTLDSFGIPVEMGEINIGPKVTRYTLKPAEGVKLARLVALNPDLALSLAAHPIRIEAPIPGKSLVGIEVPNKSAAIVRLGSLLGYPDFQKSGPLAFTIGRDISGDPIIGDIEKMPHCLVAGATGSGKSVSIHAMIVALLYKNSPATLRFIMIDPKRVELSVYNNIPHLITPVITEGKKSIAAFRWAINEMDRRYETLLQAKARDIKSYNAKEKENPLPYIVIVVDELADLMASFGREIENSIVRLAQMARATGIHLVLATQRPSVEVITGLIKANITTRMALQVASQIDSRTILDSAGAEKLLGGGDMLLISSEFSKPKRIQGAYISEEEIKGVAAFIRENNEPVLDEVIDPSGNVPNVFSTDIFNGLEGEEDVEDDMYKEAVQVVRESKKASASLLQRRLKVGYARAARLLDIMEDKGIVGPGDGAKPREVYDNPSENPQNPSAGAL